MAKLSLPAHVPSPFDDEPAFEVPPYLAKREETAPAAPTNDDPKEDPEVLNLKNEAAKARQQLAKKSAELLNAAPERMSALALEIQRLRVHVLILTEAATNSSDQNTYRELSLLNRMIQGQGIDDGDTSDLEREKHEQAAKLLEERGVSPLQAARFARVFTSMLPETTKLPPPGDEPEADTDDEPRPDHARSARRRRVN